MVFVSKKENKRQKKVAKRIFKRTGQRVGFAQSIGGGGGGRTITGGSGPLPGDPLFGKIGSGQGVTVGQPFPRSDDPNLNVITGRSPTPNLVTRVSRSFIQPSRRSSLTEAFPSRSASKAVKISGTTFADPRKPETFCVTKIVKGKRKRICRVKTKDKKIKKPLRRVGNVDKQFSFFRRIL